ncbi:MAG: hypothetical protein JNL40_08635 [Cyclobacteriaceae bacterium]|nr:hypothetical protein [Cyclobacteriaceae bacterium]
MKKTILLTFTILFNVSAYSQNIKIENEMFYTEVENGVHQTRKANFSITKETLSKIKLSDSYKMFLTDTVFLKTNLAKRKISDPAAAYLYSQVNGAVLMTKYMISLNLKNGLTFDFIEDSVGDIYFNDQSELIVRFYFKSKNDLGNEILSESNYNKNTGKVGITR